MSLLDSLTGALGGTADGSGGPLVEHVLALVHDSQSGGLAGLVSAFHQQGLGSVIQSWVGTGANATITAQQLTTVLGQERVNALAGKLGMTPDTLAGHLTTLLPQVIDRLTPHGVVPGAAAAAPAPPPAS